jgi:hypothetical protein
MLDRFRDTLIQQTEMNPDKLIVLRVTVEGETTAHDEILSRPEHWATEIRAAAASEAGERFWIEKVRFRTRPPIATKKPEGAVSELLSLVDELSRDPQALGSLASELSDLDRKLPREFKEASEVWRPDDPGRLEELLAEAKPMLMRRLLQGRGDE